MSTRQAKDLYNFRLIRVHDKISEMNLFNGIGRRRSSTGLLMGLLPHTNGLLLLNGKHTNGLKNFREVKI